MPHSSSTFDYFVFLKMFITYYSVLAYTKTVSSMLTLDQIAQTHKVFTGFFEGNLKKCKPGPHFHRYYIQNYYTQLLHTPFHGFGVSLSCFLCLSLDPFSKICSTHGADRKPCIRKRKESEYRVSLVQVQILRRLDQNPAVA